jgi:hypothetical protein
VQGKLQEIAASIRPRPYLPERMFPGLRDRIGTALDLVVEFSTLGEYRLGANGVVAAAGAPPTRPEHTVPRPGGDGHLAGWASERRAVAGGAAGRVPTATPAARARLGTRSRPQSRPRRSRAGAPQPSEQLCLAV